ncbi:MAG TPA: hypothetical protein VKC33_06800 [Burkholderiales bacterium]|nr:hypothetical protein [Burkholderiales bacterium]
MTLPKYVLGFVSAVGAAAWTEASLAMEVTAVDDQIILSGPVIGGDLAKVEYALAKNPNIRAAILRNSPGGHIRTGYAVGNLFRQMGLRTAVSGYCYSSCSRMFLGGKERFFTDDYPLAMTDVGFHGHYRPDGRQRGLLDSQKVRDYGLKDWIIKHSDGRADSNLVERWINIPVNVGLIHFFPVQIARERGGSTFFCEHGPLAGSVFACERIERSAIDLGIATSEELLRSNDHESLRATFRNR